MIFWDTSAIVPLLVDEPQSGFARRLALGDPALVVFWATAVECASALARRERDGGLSRDEADAARVRLSTARSAWTEVLASEEVRGHAERLLLRHPLRAADALQLAAALTWAGGRPRDHRLVCLDRRLGDAARGEGFHVLGA